MKFIRNKKRVLIVNEKLRRDNEMLMYLDDDYRVVGVYGDIKHALLSLPKSKPEILIVSVTQSNAHLVHLLRKFRQQLPGIKILVQTDETEESLIMEIVTVGISGILSLDTGWEQLKLSLQDIEAGIYPLNNLVAKVLLQMLQVNIDSELTSRQLQILKLMSMGKTHTTIADKLHISPETAKTHVKNIYRRLNVNSKEEALSFAVQEKLILFF